MADEENIFEDGENLQAAIGKALQDKKALLCFVFDDGDESTQWEVALLDPGIKDKLLASTVALRLQAGSEQAGFLGAVYPIQSVPAVVIVFNAQVVANYQNGQTTFEQFQTQLAERYGSASEDDRSKSSSSRPRLLGYLELPPSEGRMRLPNNAYDHLRRLTQQYLDSGVSGKGLLHIQLKLLESINTDLITKAVKDIQQQFETIAKPQLPDDVVHRLLNTPASSMKWSSVSASKLPTTSQSPNQSSNAQQSSPHLPSTSASNSSFTAQAAQARDTTNQRAPSSEATTAASNAASQRRAEYIQAQKTAEAERTRIKAQIEADKRARREADRKTREEAEVIRRRTELHELRKANSTTSDPKATDVRIQVRLFDGGTIRNSFSAESTISQHVRPWVDEEVKRKSLAGGAVEQPYNLKLILTPLPNRSIEAGEEDNALSDLEGVKSSATLVMVPVRTYVESYGNMGGGLVGSAVGTAQSVVGTGVGLIGSAAGMVFGGLGRLMGGTGSSAQADTVNTPNPNPNPNPTSDNQRVGQASRGTGGRFRTLADQRKDDEQEAEKRGTQLYNGMGLNVQPRKDEDDVESKNK